MVKNVLLSCLTISLFSTCINSMKLPAPKPNNSQKLRLDGFYYQISEIGGNVGASIYFLYENGVFRFNGYKGYNSVEELKLRMTNLNVEDSKFIFEDGKYAYYYWGLWGTYEILNNSIFIIQQSPAGGKRIGEKKGVLINNFKFMQLPIPLKKIKLIATNLLTITISFPHLQSQTAQTNFLNSFYEMHNLSIMIFCLQYFL